MASSLITPSRAKRNKPTIGFVNLGCSKNQVDSEVMLGTLVAGGFQLTGDARRGSRYHQYLWLHRGGEAGVDQQHHRTWTVEEVRILPRPDRRRVSGAAVPGRTVERIA
ncbi:MAG: hypothetical protein IPL14_12715 [Nitrospira sp.]|nr:hypothetical protein [Nitrospira sp.]